MRENSIVLGVVLAIFMTISCGTRRNGDGCNYSQANVYLSINLNDMTYSNLMFDHRYVYHQAGAKGLILYRVSATDYRVFERASPLDPNNGKALISVDNTGLLRDSLHNQYWDMEGLPYSGPSTCQVYRYPVALDGHYLNISSY